MCRGQKIRTHSDKFFYPFLKEKFRLTFKAVIFPPKEQIQFLKILNPIYNLSNSL